MTDTTTPIDLDNFPLNEALRFADENSTTGGLVTQAALKTLAAKCRELTTVTEQRDRLADVLRMTPLDLHPADGQGLCLCSQCEFRFEAAAALQSLNQPKPESKDPHRFCRGVGGNNFHCGCKYDG